jgi:hypothetical protein
MIFLRRSLKELDATEGTVRLIDGIDSFGTLFDPLRLTSLEDTGKLRYCPHPATNQRP